MEQRGSFLQWKLSLAESLSMVITVLALVGWVMSTFYRKDEAKELKDSLESRVTRIELEMSNLRENISAISRDTNYIRGRLEPRTK